MTFLLKQIFNFLKLLNSDTGHNQIAAGVACGIILGFAPSLSLQTLLVIVLLFLFRIQFGAATVSAFFFKFAAYLLDPIHHSVGTNILTNEALKPTFTAMYNAPIVPFTRFNNTIVMGSGVVSLLLAPVVFFLARFIILKYREKIVAKFKDTKIWKWWKTTTIYNWYCSYDRIFGN